MFRTLAFVVAAALIVGCAAEPDLRPQSANDPANPQAPEPAAAPLPPPLTLEPPPNMTSDTRSQVPEDALPGMGMKGMDMPEVPGIGHGSAPAATQPTTQPAAGHTLYTCKMHPQVVSDQPGKCPICGMKLVPKGGAK